MLPRVVKKSSCCAPPQSVSVKYSTYSFNNGLTSSVVVEGAAFNPRSKE
jgi:hypothetical protein